MHEVTVARLPLPLLSVYRSLPTAKNGQEAVVTAIQEFLGANRDPTIVLKQQKQHGKVRVCS